MIGILALILQIVMIVIIFSLPGRFREQREHMERQKGKSLTNSTPCRKPRTNCCAWWRPCRKTTPQHRAIRRTIEQLTNKKRAPRLGRTFFCGVGANPSAPVVSSFLTAEAQRCQCVFLPKGLAKAGVAAIATGVGDIVHAEIGIDKQFGGACHATVFEIGADGGVIAKSEASFQFLFIEVDLAA